MLKKILKPLIPKLPIILPVVAIGMLLLSETTDPISALLSKSEEEKKEEELLLEKAPEEKADKEKGKKGKKPSQGKVAGEGDSEGDGADAKGQELTDKGAAAKDGETVTESSGEGKEKGNSPIEGDENKGQDAGAGLFDLSGSSQEDRDLKGDSQAREGQATEQVGDLVGGREASGGGDSQSIQDQGIQEGSRIISGDSVGGAERMEVTGRANRGSTNWAQAFSGFLGKITRHDLL